MSHNRYTLLLPSLRRLPRSAGAGGRGVLLSACRVISYVTTAANFDQEVIQSEQAICLVYYISSSNCASYLRTAEKLVDTINTHTTDESGDAGSTTTVSDGAKRGSWIKLCTINADENRNIASAFSVERSKLPVTYFIMQGTIVDKVAGHVRESRLRDILYKFLEHFQKELNIDLLSKRSSECEASGGLSSPLPTAATADLLHGASTQFLQNKIMAALVGADMIRLPQESNQLDGLRKTIQQAKSKAHNELQDLHRQLGMEVRKLSDAEVHAHYYRSSQFVAMAVLSALEALFLARCYATLGDVGRKQVASARESLQLDFAPALSVAAVRRVVALVDINLLRGDIRRATLHLRRESNRAPTHVPSSDSHSSDAHRASDDCTQDSMCPDGHTTPEALQFYNDIVHVIDEYIDVRVLMDAFPTAVADRLLKMLKSYIALARGGGGGGSASASHGDTAYMPGTTSPASPLDTQAALSTSRGLSTTSLPTSTACAGTEVEYNKTAARATDVQQRMQHIRCTLTCLMQLYPSDPATQTMRSRLTSLLY